MTIGTIKVRFDRGFGFLTGEDKQDYFFHSTDVENAATFAALSVGDVVEFEPLVPQPVKGRRAHRIRYPETKEEVI